MGIRIRCQRAKLRCYSSFLPRYTPINIGVPLQASQSDLVSLEWLPNGITADFILPQDDTHLLRVSFDKECIVRILDEMPLSTEENDTPNEGLVSDHFAYGLEGAAFARVQSIAWKEACGPVRHYQFVTGWTCMDVLTAATPVFVLTLR